MDSLQSHESEVFASISRSETNLLKLNIVDLIDLLDISSFFIHERNFDKVAFMIYFEIDVRTENMLSTTPS